VLRLLTVQTSGNREQGGNARCVIVGAVVDLAVANAEVIVVRGNCNKPRWVSPPSDQANDIDTRSLATTTSLKFERTLV
jgi:hypothetical protein